MGSKSKQRIKKVEDLMTTSSLQADRRIVGVPDAAKPAAVPEPPDAAPVEIQRAAAAVQTAQNCPIEEDKGGARIGFFLP